MKNLLDEKINLKQTSTLIVINLSSDQVPYVPYNKSHMSVYDSTTRSISLKISSRECDWILTCLASPCKPSRQELWNYLAAVHATHQLTFAC